jgi:hypothetical protein
MMKHLLFISTIVSSCLHDHTEVTIPASIYIAQREKMLKDSYRYKVLMLENRLVDYLEIRREFEDYCKLNTNKIDLEKLESINKYILEKFTKLNYDPYLVPRVNDEESERFTGQLEFIHILLLDEILFQVKSSKINFSNIRPIVVKSRISNQLLKINVYMAAYDTLYNLRFYLQGIDGVETEIMSDSCVGETTIDLSRSDHRTLTGYVLMRSEKGKEIKTPFHFNTD